MLKCEVEVLSDVSVTQPHAAYAAFTHGIIGRWDYLIRCIPDISDLLCPLEEVIHTKLLPNLTGQCAFNDVECELLSLPPRLGGLSIINPSKYSSSQFISSVCITAPLVDLILEQSFINVLELQCSVLISSEKGSSNWLTTLPLSDHDYALHKGAFRDVLCLHYGWQPSSLTSNCVCGKSMTVELSAVPLLVFLQSDIMNCMIIFLSQQHCHSVRTEPPLQPLSGQHSTTGLLMSKMVPTLM